MRYVFDTEVELRFYLGKEGAGGHQGELGNCCQNKAEKGMHLGAASAAAAAMSLNATLLAGEDSDFSGLDIKIERI
ncbi:MAG: hypothetical protein GXO66_04725 [Euryarchaeota archaeon]|nr:hypothetical protein [Euryarchaeota archaeon]